MTFNFIFDACETLYLVINNFLLCYFLTTLPTNVLSIGNIAYDAMWYRLPSKNQSAIEIMIRRSQTPPEIKGMNLFVCKLETYVKV